MDIICGLAVRILQKKSKNYADIIYESPLKPDIEVTFMLFETSLSIFRQTSLIQHIETWSVQPPDPKIQLILT